MPLAMIEYEQAARPRFGAVGAAADLDVRLHRCSMAKYFVTVFLLLFLVAFCIAQDSEYHTTPDKWDTPRVFHTPFDNKYTDRMKFSHSDLRDCPEKVLSPNQAYWFHIQRPNTKKEGPWSTAVYVYNERTYAIKIEFLDHAGYDVRASWINEKLMYLEVWWGRILGTYIIYDVEQENVVKEEMVHYGGIDFQQWHEHRQ